MHFQNRNLAQSIVYIFHFSTKLMADSHGEGSPIVFCVHYYKYRGILTLDYRVQNNISLKSCSCMKKCIFYLFTVDVHVQNMKC